MNSHFRACLSFSTFDVWVTRSGDRYLVNQDEGLVQMFPNNSNFEVRWTENVQIIWSRGWSKHSHFDHYSYLGHIYAEVAPIPDFRRNLTFYHWCYQALNLTINLLTDRQEILFFAELQFCWPLSSVQHYFDLVFLFMSKIMDVFW